MSTSYTPLRKPGLREWIHLERESNFNEWRACRREGRHRFLHDLLFLPGKAAATDLQQIERPLASEKSATIDEDLATLRKGTFEDLSEQNLVFCNCPTVFTPSFLEANLVGG